MTKLQQGAMLSILLALTICEGKLTMRFTESDYRSLINASTVQVHITKTGNNVGNITIKLSPVTFGSYAQQPSMPCEDSVVSQFSNSAAAEEDDFDSAPQELVIPPSDTGVSNTYTFNVALRYDNVLEGDEAFVIILNVTSENEIDNVETSRVCAIVIIHEAPFTESLVQFIRNGVELSTNNADDIIVPEDAGNITLLTVVKVVETELPIRITVTTRAINDVVKGSDFRVPLTTVDILPEELNISTLIEIIDDELAETNETFTVTIHVSPVGHIYSASQTIEILILDNEVVTVGIKNSEDIITITEGEPATVRVGLINFEAQNYRRYGVALEVSTVNQNAKAGEDYTTFTGVFLPFLSDTQFNIETIKRVGIEPARTFIFKFVSDSYLTVFERRNIIIIITDSTKIPLAPSIYNLSMTNSVIETSWAQEITDDRPIDNFIVIIKACPSSPCEIQEPHMPKHDEIEYPVDENLSTHLLTGAESRKVHQVVVCAINALGKNCSAPVFLEKDPITQFYVPLAPSLDKRLMTEDSMIETTWTQEITDDRPVDNFIIIMKACSSTPCEVKDPHMPKADEHEFIVDKNVLFYLFTDVDASKVHVVLVCANNALGRNCSAPKIYTLEGDSKGVYLTSEPATEPATEQPWLLIIIVVMGILVLLLLLIILLMYIYCRWNRSRAYLPGKSIGKQLQGMSTDSNLEESYILNMKYL